MLRVRLKADGRLVEILPDGSERSPSPAAESRPKMVRPGDGNLAANMRILEAAYARNVRGRTGLTQSAFAARIGVPVETVRNWEQGKRSPRGPARALLRLIEQAPEAAFAALGGNRADKPRRVVAQPFVHLSDRQAQLLQRGARRLRDAT